MATEDAAHIVLMLNFLAGDLREAFHSHPNLCDEIHAERWRSGTAIRAWHGKLLSGELWLQAQV